jgi:hypothetical protein
MPSRPAPTSGAAVPIAKPEEVLDDAELPLPLPEPEPPDLAVLEGAAALEEDSLPDVLWCAERWAWLMKLAQATAAVDCVSDVVHDERVHI